MRLALFEVSTWLRRSRRPAAWLAAHAAVGIVAVGCFPEAPPRGPEATCVKACSTLAQQCTPRECRRGCNLVLDRLVENEGGHVIACMERHGAPCDDRAWAECATLIGPHADGGPPPPGPPKDFEDEEDQGD